jgi:HK97 family phage prohead protease
MARVGGEEIDLTPTDGMAKEAQRALDWRKEGFDGGTPVGLARARQLVNKQELSPSTVRRMHSFFSRHEVDKEAEGFRPGEPGYPSNGRVAWALWGGDAGQTWARAKSETLDRLENKTIDYLIEIEPYDDDEDEEDEDELKAAASSLKVGNYVKWRASGGTAKGRIEHIMTEGVLGIPDSSFSIQATEDDPAVLIRIYRDGGETDTLVGHRASTLTKITEEEAMKSLKRQSMQKIFKLDSSIKSVEEGETELKISGYASTGSVDRAYDKILPTAWSKGGLKNFEQNPILLFNHNYDKPIGKVVEMQTDKTGLKIKGVISKSAGDVYNLVKEGVLSTFSVGFVIKDADYDKAVDGLIVKDAELLEVSVVSVPCNQDATFSVAKSFDTQEEYLEFKKQFDNTLGQRSASTGGSSSEGADTEASRKLKMDEQNEMIQKAVAAALEASEKARAEKAAVEAAEKKAAEEMEAKVAAATAKVIASSEEKIYAELEKRFQDKEVNLEKAVEGLRTELSEKSEELKAISQSKRVFSDRSSESGDWKKVFAQDMEDAFLLGRVTGKGYDTKLAKELLEKANAHSSVQVADTNHFEREVSTNIERDIQNELILAPMFREIAMNSATMIVPIMPDAGYAEITSSAGSTTATAANGTLDTRTSSDRAGIALQEVTLRTYKMVAKSYLGNETEEDAIIPILPLLREAMIRSHARGVENLFLLGNLNVTGSAYTSNAADGLLKLVDVAVAAGNTTRARVLSGLFAANKLTSDDLLGARKNMGKYGLRPSDVVYVVSQRGYFELLEDPDFQDFNNVNQIATKLTGEVGQIYGSSVMVCDEFPAPAAGGYNALALNRRNFVVPRLRGVTVESDYLVENQHRVLVTTQRLGFKEIIENAASVVAIKYGAAT